MTAQQFASRYTGPGKSAEPFITNDKIADVLEQNPSQPQSNNVISPWLLATDACARDFVSVFAPFFPSLKIIIGPVEPPWTENTENELGHMTTSGPRTANWCTFSGYNSLNAFVNPKLMVGPLVNRFVLNPTKPELAFSSLIGELNFAAYLEPSPTEA